MLEEFFDLSQELLAVDRQAMEQCAPQFAKIERIKEYNQLKMLKAFTSCGVSASHLTGINGGPARAAILLAPPYRQRRS